MYAQECRYLQRYQILLASGITGGREVPDMSAGNHVQVLPPSFLPLFILRQGLIVQVSPGIRVNSGHEVIMRHRHVHSLFSGPGFQKEDRQHVVTSAHAC